MTEAAENSRQLTGEQIEKIIDMAAQMRITYCISNGDINPNSPTFNKACFDIYAQAAADIRRTQEEYSSEYSLPVDKIR